MATQLTKWRTMSNPIHSSAAPIRLLGHDFSVNSGKARANLRHKPIPFVAGVAPEDRQLIQDRVGCRVIPVIVTPLECRDYRIRLVRWKVRLQKMVQD
jgi:hypothetical protein